MMTAVELPDFASVTPDSVVVRFAGDFAIRPEVTFPHYTVLPMSPVRTGRQSERGDAMDFRQLVQQYHAALDVFARGDPEPVKRIYSHRDDVTLANPFGPAVHGWENTSKALDFASARFRDGKLTSVEPVAEYVAADLVTILEIERWQAKVSGRTELALFELRVTSTFRHEDGTWKMVHRHADPIATPHPDGPLRPTGA